MEAIAGLLTAGTAATATTAAATSAAAAAGWTTTVTAATAAASSSWAAISSGLAAASAIASVGGGIMALAEGNRNAQLSEVEARQVRIASDQKANALKREWLERTGMARVAFAASGVDISSGSPAATEKADETQLAMATGVERENAVLRSLNAQARGDVARSRGLAGLIQGAGAAAGTLGRVATDIVNRG